DHHAVPLGLFLALAGGLVAPLLGGGQRQVGDALARIEGADLRVLAQIADQNDLVDAARHRRILFVGLGRSAVAGWLLWPQSNRSQTYVPVLFATARP